MADTSNVVIFGKIQVEAANSNNGSASGVGSTAGTNGYRSAKINSSQNTELGFKGTEDLGNGLSAIWQVAVDVRVDGTDSTATAVSGQNFGSRNTYAGLASKTVGTVILGKHDTPYKTSTGPLDLFTGTSADYNTLMGSNGFTVASSTTSTTAPTFDARPGNLVMYTSPKFNGFDVKAAWSATNETNTTANSGSVTNKGNIWSLSANYANGPIFATFAHEEQKAARNNLASSTTLVGYSATNQAVKGKATKLGFGYNFGATKVGVIWERVKDNANAASNATDYSGFGLTNSRDRKAWYLGAAHSIGKTTMKLAYTHMGDMDGLSESGAKQWALGADYAFSKRTSVYALYTKMSNERNAAYSLGQGGTSLGTNVAGTTGGAGTASGGADPSALAVGMIHTF
ncbi:MAG: hypothetical protein A2Z01_01080 [Betaproteobacteria bacterium RBG_16_58_11]|nr:MAG: hypothetical protein A2Z01_01080 [Betaproteobacteria bacterium RBG_16_58_11]